MALKPKRTDAAKKKLSVADVNGKLAQAQKLVKEKKPKEARRAVDQVLEGNPTWSQFNSALKLKNAAIAAAEPRKRRSLSFPATKTRDANTSHKKKTSPKKKAAPEMLMPVSSMKRHSISHGLHSSLTRQHTMPQRRKKSVALLHGLPLVVPPEEAALNEAIKVVREDGKALINVPQPMRGEVEVEYAAVQQNRGVLKMLDERYTEDPKELTADASESVARRHKAILAASAAELETGVIKAMSPIHNRIRITPTQAAPYSGTCFLELVGRKFTATGFLYDAGAEAPNFLLVTAAHCLYARHSKEYVDAIRIFPARDGAFEPHAPIDLAHSVVKSFVRVPDEYVALSKDTAAASMDFGALALPKECYANKLARCYKYTVKPLSDSVLEDTRSVALHGYPEGDGVMWGSQALPLKSATSDKLLNYPHNGCPGQSGSPVFAPLHSNGHVVIGVHTAHYTEGTKAHWNSGLRFTPENKATLDRWAGTPVAIFTPRSEASKSDRSSISPARSLKSAKPQPKLARSMSR